MQTISLTRGLVAKVDDEDFKRLARWKWMARPGKSGSDFYAVRDTRRGGKLRTVRMHRVIMVLTEGDGLWVDHISGDSLDNRKANLRLSTRKQNRANSGLSRNNYIGFKGVQLARGGPSCIASCRGKYLGTYSDAEAAAIAYDLEAIRVYGSFARLNLVDPAQPLPEWPEKVSERLGRKGHMGKLTEEEVREARIKFSPAKRNCRELSRAYGVSEGAMANLLKRRTYRWVK